MCLLLSACSDIKVRPQEDIYFSISPFIDNLANELENKNAALSKQALLNGKQDSSLIQNVNWENELSIFKEAEINKTAYKGKIAVDSNVNKLGQQVLNYKTDDKKIRVKSLSVTKDQNGNIQHIEIKMATKNTLYHSVQHLELFPDRGFNVSGAQNIIQLSADTFSLEGRFIFE